MASSQRLGARNQGRVALRNELANRSISLSQSRLLGQEHNSNMPRVRFLPESRTMHHHHVLLPNQFLDEDFIALRNVDAREGVERATRRNTTHPRRRFAPFLRQVTTRAQLALHFRQMVLRSFERSLDRILLGM